MNIEITDDEYKLARIRGEAAIQRGAASVRIDENRNIIILMRNGVSAVIPISLIPIPLIANAPLEKLATVEDGGFGDHVWFPDLDEGYNTTALLEQAFGRMIRASGGRKGGRKKTAAKSAAARANGAKGGRPRKPSAA